MSEVTVLPTNYWARVRQIASATGTTSAHVLWTLQTLGHFVRTASSRVFATPIEADAIVGVLVNHVHMPVTVYQLAPRPGSDFSTGEYGTCRCGTRVRRHSLDPTTRLGLWTEWIVSPHQFA